MVHIQEFQFAEGPEFSHDDNQVLDIYGQLYGIHSPTPDNRANFRREFTDNRCFVMTDDESVVAVANYQSYDQHAYLFGIAVSEKRRRVGYGALMMDHLQQVTKESGGDHLELTAQGDNAIHFYRKLGFQIINDDDPDYPLMRKSVSS